MHNVPCFPILIVFILAIGIGSTAQAVSPPPCRTPESIGLQTKPDTSTPDDLDAIAALGARYIRRGFYWDKIEPSRGEFDFKTYDALIEKAEKLDLGIVAVLFGGNKAYEDDGEGGIQTAPGREGFANFAATLAKRYKGRTILWEIWNEPNVRTFWRKSGKHNSEPFADEYTALVKAVAPAMVKADPECFVMAGSLSNYWEPSYAWTEMCFKKGILDTGIRGWSVHPYGVKTPEEHVVGHQRIRDLLKQYGKPDFTMLNTERGFAVKKTEEGWSGGSEELALQYQCWHLVRQYLIDQMSGVPLTMWYEWKGVKFGLIAEGKPRPAFATMKILVQQLRGYAFAERIKTESDLDYVLRFKNPDGGQILIAWTAPPPKQTPDQAKPHEIAIVAPTDAKQLSVVDLQGNPSTVEIRDGKIRILLSGAPQYIRLPGSGK